MGKYFVVGAGLLLVAASLVYISNPANLHRHRSAQAVEAALPQTPVTAELNAIEDAVTHSVWRSVNGDIEDECESIGFPVPRGRGSWVRCVVNGEQVPLYVEAPVTVYPFPITVNRNTDTVWIDGAPTITVGN